MKFEVKDKVALVTGANRGIGKSIVETLFKHGAAKVYVAVRNLDSAQPLVEAFGDKAVPVEIDLSKPETIKAAATVATDVELVVNNAGILNNASPLSADVFAMFEQELQVNVYGLLHMAQAFAPVLKANGGGAFVQLNSVASLKNFADFSTYSASKAAAYSFTQGLREVLEKQNTQVVSVHPGPIDTDMVVQAGLKDISQPPELVSESIVAALAAGEQHTFPDDMAKQMWEPYEAFARNVVEVNMTEG